VLAPAPATYLNACWTLASVHVRLSLAGALILPDMQQKALLDASGSKGTGRAACCVVLQVHDKVAASLPNGLLNSVSKVAQ